MRRAREEHYWPEEITEHEGSTNVRRIRARGARTRGEHEGGEYEHEREEIEHEGTTSPSRARA